MMGISEAKGASMTTYTTYTASRNLITLFSPMQANMIIKVEKSGFSWCLASVGQDITQESKIKALFSFSL